MKNNNNVSVKTATMQDVKKALENTNAIYGKREKTVYSKVADSIANLQTIVTRYNNNVMHNAFDTCDNVQDFAKIASASKLIISLDKEGVYQVKEMPCLYTLDLFIAWKHANDKQVNIPADWDKIVIQALADMCGSLVKSVIDCNTDIEFSRIQGKYKTVITGSKRNAKKSLQALLDVIMPNKTLTGLHQTKIMLGLFKLDKLTFKVSLPNTDTLLKAFTGLLVSLENDTDIDTLFNWNEAKK